MQPRFRRSDTSLETNGINAAETAVDLPHFRCVKTLLKTRQISRSFGIVETSRVYDVPDIA
jgi:hypothetical protein